MATEMEVGLRVRARADEATRALTRVFTEVATGSERAERSMSGLARESRRMSDARAVLGVRAEQTIQREIRQTEAAYQRLANAGTMSAREQSRAYDAMRTRVAELRREMAGVNQLQRGMVAGARGLPLVGAAVGTGAAMMARPMGQVASYDMRLAQMANTAFSDTEEHGRRLTEEEQLARRRAGKAQLESYITNATAQGGTREDAAGALDMLIARGIFSPDEAGQLLPMITKAATAAGSSAQEMTGVVMAAVQNAKIPIEQIPKALGMALRAGQLGGFELKDMATWLPKMLAMGGLPGLRGTDGMASILAASQLAMTAAGSSDDAGNNVVNFLQKITSADTAKDFAKLSSRTMGDKRKGEAGIDLYGTLAQARSEGVDPIEAFTRLVRRVAEADKEFVRLQKMAAASGDDKEKSAMYGSMADILQSRGVGKTIQDRQAMLALLPMLFNPKQYTDLKAGILQGDESTLNVNQAFIREQAAFKFQQGQNAWEKGQYDALGGLNSAVGDVASKLAEYGAQYPGLTASLVGATTAIKALAAAAMAGSLASVLTGRMGGAGSARLASEATGRVGAAAAAARAARFGGALALAGAGLEAYSVSNNQMLSDAQKRSEYTRVAGGAGGAIAGAAAGAAAGSVVPGIGTAIGAITGGILGQLGGDKLGKLLGDALFKAEAAKQPQPITVHSTLTIDGRQVAEAVNQTNAVAARRN
ncbi:phage tail tape measure protein [Cupriavidus gilardii]|uniref:phage tail tape measure protein n=1 Tax=Cupriavidus gilardii TaxID=82541 RepID=UPI0021B3217E|nr:phage tail tape measure protein [Cupriavidus gilardii]UXC35163.1 phage tail tape measure protein [Cupriavidus gilardii]